ncbi:hypothetical protein SAMN04487944_10824 [Gracilibacillus ureilyticus]|uniref:Uncharacterized protein n=1 Tax=Gracilibacillus ureilyticus TaxID=531814 RepID=A0A1H9R4T7_9BACI|nr:hypothetical protein SAMN04487944_10824 [Gracilibacillus ureilyticus]
MYDKQENSHRQDIVTNRYPRYIQNISLIECAFTSGMMKL